MDSSVTTTLVLLLPTALLALVVWGVVRWFKRIADNVQSVDPAQGLAGVRGWLLFLIVGFTILGPLFGATGVNADFMAVEAQFPDVLRVNSWATYKTITWSIFLAASCLSVYAGYGLLKRRDRSVVTRAQRILWIIGPGHSVIVVLLLPRAMFGQVEFDPQVMASIVVSTVSAAIWSLYLSQSRRVQATYGEGRPAREKEEPQSSL